MICIDDVLSMFTEHDQAFVRRDLEAAWDGSEPFTVEVEVPCKTGDNEYKKHYLGISDNVTYFVEQMDPVSVDTFHYKVQFRPEELLPDADVQISGGDN